MKIKIFFASLFISAALMAGCGRQKKPMSMAELELYLNSHYLDANGCDSLLAMYPESDFMAGLKAMALNEDGDTAQARALLKASEKRHPTWKKSVCLRVKTAAKKTSG